MHLFFTGKSLAPYRDKSQVFPLRDKLIWCIAPVHVLYWLSYNPLNRLYLAQTHVGVVVFIYIFYIWFRFNLFSMHKNRTKREINIAFVYRRIFFLRTKQGIFWQNTKCFTILCLQTNFDQLRWACNERMY